MAREDRESRQPNTNPSSASGLAKNIQRLRDGAQDSNPNMRMIAPSTGPTRNRPDMSGVMATRPDMSGVMDTTLQSMQKAFPNTAQSALEQASLIRQAEDRSGFAGGAAAGIRALPSVYIGAGKDFLETIKPATKPVARFFDELLTGGNTSQIAAGRSNRPTTLSEVTPQGTRIPRATVGVNEGRIASNEAFGGVTMDPARGNILGEETGRTVALGDQARNPVNYFDNRSALDEFGAANRIRQQTVDAQGPGGGGYIGTINAGPSAEQQADALLSRLDGRQSVAQEQGIRARANALLGREAQSASMSEVQAREAGSTDRALLQAETDSERNQAISDSAMMRAQAAGRARQNPISASDFKSLIDSGAIVQGEDGRPDLSDPQTATLYAQLLDSLAPGGFEDQRIGMAEGGVVPQAQSAMAMPNLGEVGPSMPMNEDLQAYQQLSSGMREMGLQPVGFDQFMSMRQQPAVSGAGQAPVGPEMAGPTGAIAMAGGGMVPDVSGKMVVDSDPNAPTDSIPAMIDGQTPAALDSGEFVIPKDVVMFYGTDKLNKMLAAARKTDTNGTESQNVGGSAIQEALSAAGGSAPGYG